MSRFDYKETEAIASRFSYDREDLERIAGSYVMKFVNDEAESLRPCEVNVYRDLHGNGFMHYVYSVGGPRVDFYGCSARGFVLVAFGRETVCKYVPGDAWSTWWAMRGPLIMDWPV